MRSLLSLSFPRVDGRGGATLMPDRLSYACPVLTIGDADRVMLAHGDGARLTRRFITDRLLTRFQHPSLALLGDAAVLASRSGPLAFTADSFVVSPLFFPGGDIGSLAVYGTVNDLVVAGARPLWLSLSLIIEEGLAFAVLDKVLDSIAEAAKCVGVEIVTGDTKVVPRGAVDGLFINTSGIGEFSGPVPVGPASLRPGDQLLLTGPVGRHGMAVLAARETFAVEPLPVSDCGSLLPAVEALRRANIPFKAMRDATRGGVAAVLHEWSEACGCTLAIDEKHILVTPEVRGLCELLGLDPLYVANEGTMLVAIPAEFVESALQALRTAELAKTATCIGSVQKLGIANVTIRRALGREQPLEEPAGALLPRIC